MYRLLALRCHDHAEQTNTRIYIAWNTVTPGIQTLDNQCSEFYRRHIVNLNHMLLIVAGLHGGSKIVSGDRTMCSIKTKKTVLFRFNSRQQQCFHEAYNSIHDDVKKHYVGRNLFLLDQFKLV